MYTMAGIIKTEDTASEAGSISEEERIRKLFQVCDGDGDGYIDSEDLLSICRKLNLEQCVGELMQELGADEQGRISYQGFLRRRLELAGQVEAAARCLGEGDTTATEEEEEEEEGGHWGGGGRGDSEHTKTPLSNANSGSGGNIRQPEYRQPTSSENSLGAGSGGRQERWEFDSGARDLSPEPQASPGAIRGQTQAPGQGLQGSPNVQGPPSVQGPGVGGSPIPQGGGTASLLDMANKLHLAALSSLKSEIQDLSGQLKAVTQERDFLERSLSKAQLEKLRLVHDAEERLDSQAQRYEGRLTELHCVIAELSRKIRGQTSRMITEEEEEDESTTTAADDDEDDEVEAEAVDVEDEEIDDEEDGTGSQSVAADTTQDDLSGVCGEEEGVETETQDCCELESGRTELVDGEGTVVPDDATDNTHTQDLAVVQREEEEGLEQQRRLHQKVKELQGNLQQLQIITPVPIAQQSPASTLDLKCGGVVPPLARQVVPPPPPPQCCHRGSGGGCHQPRGVDGSPRRRVGGKGEGSPSKGNHALRTGEQQSVADCHAPPIAERGSITASELVDLGVCCNSRTAEHLVRDIREESSAQELQLAARRGAGVEGGDITPVWASNQCGGRRAVDTCHSSSVVRLQMESPPVGEPGAETTSPCGCLPILRALELEVERQASRAESHRASAELALLSLDECRCSCEHQALLLGRRGSDIVGLATAMGYAIPLCRALYILSRLLDSKARDTPPAPSHPASTSGTAAEGQVGALPKNLIPEFQPKGSERSRSKRRQSSRGGGSPPRQSDAEKSWLCRKREELGKSWRKESAAPSVVVVDEGGGYGKINRSVATEEAEGSSSSGEPGEAVEVGATHNRALDSEAAAFVEGLDRRMRSLDMSEWRAEEVARGGVVEGEEEEWVLTKQDFLWLESLGVEEEDGSPDMLRRLGRHISVLMKKLFTCGIGLKKAKLMAKEASASEGELGLPPHDPKSESPRPTAASSSPGGRKADLEVAVLMQELMAMREERAALRARLHTLEGEREELGRLCELLKPGQTADGIAGASPSAVPSAKDVMEVGRQQRGEIAPVEAPDGMAMSSREQWLEGRLQELALALEQVATSADLRLRQSTAVMNDLRRTNGTLAHSLERCRRRYQQRLKTLEGQMENLVERHASQVRTLRQRISQLEEKGGGGASLDMRCRGRASAEETAAL
ncbi:colorectal mutant cancer protein [Ischnura elegans]|uniref:colorectal mutant cancer protein n=1 Tax=Ischnura elegans TaxID=197161 RepID=UPI001ED86928|nr:colorectal mutant cancer protein [Ischnura elegans]